MTEPTSTRRDFLHVLFKTVPSLSLVGPALFDLWPKEAAEREVAAPFELVLDSSGYVIDPDCDVDHTSLPTLRELLEGRYDFAGASRARQDEILCEHYGYDPENEEETRAELEGDRERLDDRVDPEEISPYELAQLGEQSQGIEIYEALLGEGHEDLGLHLVEGDHPGSHFTGVRFVGDVDRLNCELARRGLNLVVRR
jgi:hypothetical protein